jgi:hypothetical protein
LKFGGHFKIAGVMRKRNQAVLRDGVSIEVEGRENPVLAAEWLTIALFGQG